MSRWLMLSKVAGIALILLFIPAWAQSQDDGYVDYYNEEAAGVVGGEAEVEAAGDTSPSVNLDADSSVNEEQQSSEEDVQSEFGDDTGEPVVASNDATDDADTEDKKPWEWGGPRYHSTLTGSTGLLNMAQAKSGPAGTFGLGVHGAFFKYSDYLQKGDTNSSMWSNFNVRITPLEFLEIHYGISASANSNNMEYPELFQAMGDMDLGVKGFYTFKNWVTLGMDVNMTMVNSVGDVSLDWSGTSFTFDALAQFDFLEINESVPVRGHLLFGYKFDRSANIIADVESENGGCGSGDSDDIEYEGCISPVERTALGINRNDQLRIGIGLDAPLPYVSPILEYRLDIPVNRQGFTCPEGIPGSYDRCMEYVGGSAFHQILTLGARVLLPIEDLAIDVGLDIGLTGYAPTVHEMAAAAPYRIIFGLSYNFDPFKEPPPAPPVVAPPVIEEVEPPPPPARIAGYIHDEASPDKPIAGAVVRYKDMSFNNQVATSEGKFLSYELPPGPVWVEVSAEDYTAASFEIEIPETGNVDQKFALKAIPKKAKVMIRLVDEEDNPVAGVEIDVKGAKEAKFKSDESGKVVFESDGGELFISIDNEAYLSKRTKVVAEVDAKTKVQVQLRKKPTKSLVVVQKKQIRIKRKIHFETNSDEISTKSHPLMDEIADTLIRHPEIKAVEIQGHTDDRGGRKANVELSSRRAESVRAYLVNLGVEGSRLTTKGFGPDRPIAPNITGGGRARNRRVEFHITEKAAE